MEKTSVKMHSNTPRYVVKIRYDAGIILDIGKNYRKLCNGRVVSSKN